MHPSKHKMYVFPQNDRLHPLRSEWWGPDGGELLHRAVQVSQLRAGLSDDQAWHEPQQGQGGEGENLIKSYFFHIFRLLILFEVKQSCET